MGKTIIIIGIVVLIAGLLIQFTNFNLSWFGKLPGDIRIKRPGYSFYFPVTSMILISGAISVIFWLIRKFNL